MGSGTGYVQGNNKYEDNINRLHSAINLDD